MIRLRILLERLGAFIWSVPANVHHFVKFVKVLDWHWHVVISRNDL